MCADLITTQLPGISRETILEPMMWCKGTHTHTYICTDVIEKDEQGSTYFRLPQCGHRSFSVPCTSIKHTWISHRLYLNIPHGSKCSDTLRPNVSGPFVFSKKWLLLEVLKESKYARE